MYAVIALSGHQYIVKQGDEISIDGHIPLDTFHVSDVLCLFTEEKMLALGAPFVASARIECTPLSHEKDEKVRIVKFKRKTRYERRAGFTPLKTKVLIANIVYEK